MTRIEEIRKRHAKATPGPYRLGGETRRYKDGTTQTFHPETIKVPTLDTSIASVFGVPSNCTMEEIKKDARWARGLANGQFLAHSWEDIQFLLAEIERLKGESR